jgi:hypothetical protein
MLGIMASGISGNLWAPAGSYDSISSVTLSAAASTITFSGIPSTYTHLQIRWMAGNSIGTVGNLGLCMKFNSDSTAGNYANHAIQGTGSAVEVGNTPNSGIANGTDSRYGIVWGNSATDNIFSVGIIDILDYADTNKNKTIRHLRGVDANGSVNGRVGLDSVLWKNTAAINNIVFAVTSYNFVANSSFALYGVK